MQNDECDPYPATPEERASHAEYDREAAEVEERIRELISLGYTADGVRWVHPTDKDRWYIFDPLTNERIFSPKVAELIDADLEEETRRRES